MLKSPSPAETVSMSFGGGLGQRAPSSSADVPVSKAPSNARFGTSGLRERTDICGQSPIADQDDNQEHNKRENYRTHRCPTATQMSDIPFYEPASIFPT